jgi:hypothetical protein
MAGTMVLCAMNLIHADLSVVVSSYDLCLG